MSPVSLRPTLVLLAALSGMVSPTSAQKLVELDSFVVSPEWVEFDWRNFERNALFMRIPWEDVPDKVSVDQATALKELTTATLRGMPVLAFAMREANGSITIAVQVLGRDDADTCDQLKAALFKSGEPSVEVDTSWASSGYRAQRVLREWVVGTTRRSVECLLSARKDSPEVQDRSFLVVFRDASSSEALKPLTYVRCSLSLPIRGTPVGADFYLEDNIRLLLNPAKQPVGRTSSWTSSAIEVQRLDQGQEWLYRFNRLSGTLSVQRAGKPFAQGPCERGGSQKF